MIDLRSATTTLHVRRKAWYILLWLEIVTMLLTVFLGFYCDPESDRCDSAETLWDEEVRSTRGIIPRTFTAALRFVDVTSFLTLRKKNTVLGEMVMQD